MVIEGLKATDCCRLTGVGQSVGAEAGVSVVDGLDHIGRVPAAWTCASGETYCANAVGHDDEDCFTLRVACSDNC